MGTGLDSNIVSDKESAMYRRPLSVSIIGWLLSIVSVLAILKSFSMLFLSGDTNIPFASKISPLSSIIHLVFDIITFVSAVNILSGANWARWLYTTTCAFFLVLDFIILGGLGHDVLPTIMRGTVILFLFLPGANDFFSSH